MKITQRKAVSAYRALLRMSEQPLPLPAALALFRAKKALEEPWDFQLEQEQKMIAECRGTVSPDGSVTFPDDASRAEYVKRAQKLNALETEIALPAVRIDAADGWKLSLNELSALDGIVRFGDPAERENEAQTNH